MDRLATWNEEVNSEQVDSESSQVNNNSEHPTINVVDLLGFLQPDETENGIFCS